MEDDPPSLLILVVDLDPLAWAVIDKSRGKQTGDSVTTYLESVLIFVDSHLLFNERNRVVVCTAFKDWIAGFV